MNPTRRQVLGAVGATAGAALAPRTLAGTASGQQGTDWQMFGFDRANTGHNPTVSGPTENVGPTWRFETDGGVMSSAAVVDGTVYVGSRDDYVYALDADDGTLQWQFQTGDAVESSPAVVDGTVYVGSFDGTIYALAADSGAIEWEVSTGGRIGSSPTVADGVVYVGSRDNYVYALDADSGERVWRVETGFWVETAPAVVGDTVYVGSEDNSVYALSAEDGEEEWSFETGDTVSSSPAIVDGIVYVGSLDTHLHALDADTGERQWSFETGGAVAASPAVVPPSDAPDEATGGVAYVGSRSHALHAVDTGTGEQLWEFDTGRPILSSASVADGVVYVGSENATVYGLDAADGTVLWESELGSSILSSPSVVGDSADGGTVYVGSRDEHVYALTADAGELTTQTPSDGATDPGGEKSGGGRGGLWDYRFLLWPVAIASGVAAVGGMYYGAKRAGLFELFEDVGAQPSEYDREPEDSSDSEAELPIWEVVRDDVIDRAEETDSTATQDLLVTKYVDSETMSAPMVAYEIESFRDDPAHITLVEEPESSLSPDDVGSLPGSGEEWSLTSEGLVFEADVDPGETRKTLVARRDVDPGDDDELLDRPDVTVDAKN